MDIISFFLEDPERKFHVREVARLSKQSPTTVSFKLKEFQKQGLLLSKEERNHLLYRANSESQKYKDMKFYHNLQLIRSSGVIGHLDDFFNHPPAIILFGSFRKSENAPFSDIDILIISAKKGEPDLRKFEVKLKHKIQLFVYSQKEFQGLPKKNRELFNSFINGFVLSGYLEVL
jgi:hypothetical protein